MSDTPIARASEASALPPDAAGTARNYGVSGTQRKGAFSVDQIKGAMADSLGSIGQSGSADHLRGYANEVIGETKLKIGLAVGSFELAVVGIAQKALGQAQRYIGEAKMATEMEKAPVTDAVEPCDGLHSDRAAMWREDADTR